MGKQKKKQEENGSDANVNRREEKARRPQGNTDDLKETSLDTYIGAHHPWSCFAKRFYHLENINHVFCFCTFQEIEQSTKQPRLLGSISAKRTRDFFLKVENEIIQHFKEKNAINIHPERWEYFYFTSTKGIFL